MEWVGSAWEKVDLAGDREDVVLEVAGDGRVEVVEGQAVVEGEMGVVDGQPLFEQLEDALPFQFAIEPVHSSRSHWGRLETVEFALGALQKRQNFSRSIAILPGQSPGDGLLL